ncbi:aaa family protein, partial [Cystoisospora suis]
RRFFGVRARNTQQAFAALDRYFTSFSSSSFVSRRPSSRVHTPAEHTLGDAIGGGGEEEDEVERHGSEKEKEGRTKSEDEEEEEEEEGRRSGKRRSTGRKREREEPKKKKNSSSSSSSSVSSRSPQGKEKISREDRYRDSIYRNGKRCEVEELCSQRSDDFLNKREEEDSEREDEGEEEKENEVYYSYYYGKKGRRRKKGSILHRDWTTRIVKGRKRRTCVLVVDEIDCLVTPKQRVLYTLFDWPTQPHAKLVVLGIANTIDLPDRLLSSRCSSRVGFGRLVFNPYTREEIETIILARLRECKDLFDEYAGLHLSHFSFFLIFSFSSFFCSFLSFFLRLSL